MLWLQVKIVPVGLVFTHREKFRSDLCMRYCEPITVSAASMQDDSFAAAKQVETYS